ncbi:MAG: isoprenylcysteine carboxylmethyltransferase family protein [Pseudomonadota bacterium]|nr:isoprenylcysteine carboxylmethyltransferase family protein [Pseudomonadota bacterium]
MQRLEHLIPPPLVGLIVALAMSGAARAFAPIEAPLALRNALALVVGAAGLAIALAGVLTFRRLGANVNPHRIDRGEVLVTSGVYRFTRNPMYLGLTLFLCGYALWLARPIGALGPVAFVAYITRFQILPEERAMRAKFGAAYEAYARATRRWV